ncbi:hypothetical protein [Aliiroseovarius sp. F20344]|uniref:hypothetical protein n=1 Tax=Aliiroseovarius sp. F20344 TaxID=2926414 RepID=UPI001FF6D235|nr:hypothetical protein [Aliiroseovarius sp. F20344]MCK0142249.1 hypothetical protein [Aliiroseovarius sp. F20344]
MHFPGPLGPLGSDPPRFVGPLGADGVLDLLTGLGPDAGLGRDAGDAGLGGVARLAGDAGEELDAALAMLSPVKLGAI